MNRETDETSGPPRPELKKWLLVQLIGGVVTMAGVLLTVYALAQRQQAALPLELPRGAWLLPAGLVVHLAGRFGARRASVTSAAQERPAERPTIRTQ